MTGIAVPTAHKILTDATSMQIRPRYEGSNICTWIGFKHVNYLVEEAVLEHFRRGALAARSLYEDHGLCLEIVKIDTRILHALHMDDLVTAEVVPTMPGEDRELAATVTLRVDRGGELLKAVTSKVRVVLRTDTRRGPVDPAVEEIAAFTVRRVAGGIGALPSPPAETRADLQQGGNTFVWTWRIPYFYCHFNERLQMSGYLRVMEEVVDLFLADRGISIKTLLDDQSWIPVVPHSAIHMLDEALMEEDLITVFTVEDVFKDLTYTARMDCYVPRDDRLLRTATGRITHGYAVIANRRDWSLVNLDGRVLTALRGTGS